MSTSLFAAPFAYITNQLDNSVSIIDTANGTVRSVVKIGLKPAGVATTNDGQRIYITNPESKNISVLDGKSHRLIDSVPKSFCCAVCLYHQSA